MTDAAPLIEIVTANRVMSYMQELEMFAAVIVALVIVNVVSVATAFIAVREMRRFRLIAAARDPLWNAGEDDSIPPFARGLVERFRHFGGV
jgi:hypothetical protein